MRSLYHALSLELFTLAAREAPLEWKIRLARVALAEAERILDDADESPEGALTIHALNVADAEENLAKLEAEQLRRLQSSTAAAVVFHNHDDNPAPANSTATAAAVSISSPARGALGDPATGGSFCFPPLESAGEESISGRSIPAPSQSRCGHEPAPAIADGGGISNTKTT